MKAAEQNFPVVLFIAPLKVVLTFDSLDEILKCSHSNKSYRAVLSCGTVKYAVQFYLPESMDTILEFMTIQVKGTEQNIPVVLFIMLY